MCRTGVYKRIRELRGDAGLHGATTITLQPLSPIKICDHLHHYRDQLGVPKDIWGPITDQIRNHPDGPLATALRTPWLLGLAVTALARDRRTVTQLAASRDTTEIRDLLFAALIPAAIHGTRRTGPTRDYTEQKVQTWMHTLAQHLERRRAGGMGASEITLGEVWALAGTRRCRALHALAAGLIVGLVLMLVFLSYPPHELMDALGGALDLGLIVGFVVGLMPGLPVRSAASVSAPKRFAWRVPGRSRWRRGRAVGLTVWVAVGLAAGLAAGLGAHGRYGLVHALMLALMLGLTVGLAVGLAAALAAVLTANVTAPKRFAWRVPGRSRWRRGLAVGLAAGVAVGLADELMRALPTHAAIARLEGVMVGTGVGLLIGFMTGLGTNAADRLALGQDARRVIHDDLVAALTAGLAVGLAVWVAVGLVGVVVLGTVAGLALGLAFAIPSGLVVGLLTGLTAGRHATASLLFTFTETFPARPVHFLEWARNAGLLRVTGIAYQCRHDSYQQWLAAGYVDRGVKTTVNP